MATPNSLLIEQKLQQALALHVEGRLAEADALYRQILQKQPKHVHALHLAGVVALHTNRAERAVKLIRRAIGLDANLPDPHNNLGLALLELGRTPAALAEFDATLGLRPEHAEAQYNRGLALKTLGRDAEALAAFESSATLRPGFMPPLYSQAQMLAQSGRPAEALAVLDALIAQSPGHAEAHRLRDTVLQDVRRADAAPADQSAAADIPVSAS